MNTKLKNVRIYDNGGKTADRYTAIYMDYPYRNVCNGQPMSFQSLGMDDRPFHPQGIGQHGEAMVGRHLGKRISFKDLPIDCQIAILQDLT